MADWHPIMAAVERAPAVWVMVDPSGVEYGQIELRRTKDGPRYRAEFWGKSGHVHIGWATTLRTACGQVHQAYLRSMKPSGPPNSDWAKQWPTGEHDA